MFEYTNRLKLPLLVPNQSKKEITHNEAMVIIDNLLQNHIISKTLTTPPEEPNFGDMYIVADGGTEKWLSKDKQLTIFDNGWRFVEPIDGMLFYVLDENCFYIYKNDWIKLENLMDFTKLKTIKIDNLQTDELIKYNGNNFVNSREINLLKLYINNKLLIDENLNVSIRDNNDLINIISITTGEIDFKNNIKIAGVIIDDYIINLINTNINNLLKTDLSNINEDGENFIKNMVSNNIGDMVITNYQNYCLPDYDSTISGVGNNYIAPCNGYFWFSFGNTNTTRIISINTGQKTYTYNNVLNAYGAPGGYMILLSKGNKITIGLTTDGLSFSYFIPLKGAIIDNN